MYIKLPTENLNEDKTFIRLLQEFYSAKAALTDYLNDHMGFVLEAEAKRRSDFSLPAVRFNHRINGLRYDSKHLKYFLILRIVVFEQLNGKLLF